MEWEIKESNIAFVQIDDATWIQLANIGSIHLYRKQIILYPMHQSTSSSIFAVDNKYLRGFCETIGLPYEKIFKQL